MLARMMTSCLVHLSHWRKTVPSVNRGDKACANLEAVCWSGCLSAWLICQDYMPICQNTLPQLGSATLLHLTFLESNQEPIAHRQETLLCQGVPLILIGLIVWMNNHRGMRARGSKCGRRISFLQAKWTAWVSKGHCCPWHKSLPYQPSCYGAA